MLASLTAEVYHLRVPEGDALTRHGVDEADVDVALVRLNDR